MNSILTTQAQSNFDQQYQNFSSIQTMSEHGLNKKIPRELQKQQIDNNFKEVLKRIEVLEKNQQRTQKQLESLNKQIGLFRGEFKTQIDKLNESDKKLQKKVDQLQKELIQTKQLLQQILNKLSSKSISSTGLLNQETGYFNCQQEKTSLQKITENYHPERKEEVQEPKSNQGQKIFFQVFSLSQVFRKSTKIMFHISNKDFYPEAILKFGYVTLSKESSGNKKFLNILKSDVRVRQYYSKSNSTLPIQTNIAKLFTDLIKQKQFKIFSDLVHDVVEKTMKLNIFEIVNIKGIILRTQNIQDNILSEVSYKFSQCRRAKNCPPCMITKKGQKEGKAIEKIEKISLYVREMQIQ